MRNICEDESTNRVTGAGCFLHCLKVAASSPKKNPKKPRQPRRSVSLTPIHDCSFSFSFPAVETNVILWDFPGNSRESAQHSREREDSSTETEREAFDSVIFSFPLFSKVIFSCSHNSRAIAKSIIQDYFLFYFLFCWDIVFIKNFTDFKILV